MVAQTWKKRTVPDKQTDNIRGRFYIKLRLRVKSLYNGGPRLYRSSEYKVSAFVPRVNNMETYPQNFIELGVYQSTKIPLSRVTSQFHILIFVSPAITWQPGSGC